jgi:hypothetical protein
MMRSFAVARKLMAILNAILRDSDNGSLKTLDEKDNR